MNGGRRQHRGMLASEIVRGLYQWSAPHPERTPGAEPV